MKRLLLVLVSLIFVCGSSCSGAGHSPVPSEDTASAVVDSPADTVQPVQAAELADSVVSSAQERQKAETKEDSAWDWDWGFVRDVLRFAVWCVIFGWVIRANRRARRGQKETWKQIEDTINQQNEKIAQLQAESVRRVEVAPMLQPEVSRVERVVDDPVVQTVRPEKPMTGYFEINSRNYFVKLYPDTSDGRGIFVVRFASSDQNEGELIDIVDLQRIKSLNGTEQALTIDQRSCALRHANNYRVVEHGLVVRKPMEKYWEIRKPLHIQVS